MSDVPEDNDDRDLDAAELLERDAADYTIGPMKRTGHQAVVLHPTRQMLIYGGALRTYSKLGDLWSL